MLGTPLGRPPRSFQERGRPCRPHQKRGPSIRDSSLLLENVVTRGTAVGLYRRLHDRQPERVPRERPPIRIRGPKHRDVGNTVAIVVERPTLSGPATRGRASSRSPSNRIPATALAAPDRVAKPQVEFWTIPYWSAMAWQSAIVPAGIWSSSIDVPCIDRQRIDRLAEIRQRHFGVDEAQCVVPRGRSMQLRIRCLVGCLEGCLFRVEWAVADGLADDTVAAAESRRGHVARDGLNSRIDISGPDCRGIERVSRRWRRLVLQPN